ncbi:MAG: hypothetical protein P8124_14260 [Gammaproteobacteria bacterium]
MEFFAYARAPSHEQALQRLLTVASLPRWCHLIDRVWEADADAGMIYCLWGEFRVRRESIRGGVRFTLPGCPNGVAWTVTAGLPPAPEAIVTHCTINRPEHAPEFVESLQEFVEAWAQGLERTLPELV